MTSHLAICVRAAALATLFSAVVVAQTTVSLTPDKDTTLYEDPTGSLANGSGASFFVGRVGLNGGGTARRGLVHFDVSGSVPAGAVVIAAQLELFSAQSSAFLPITTTGHRVLQSWSEGATIAPGQGGSGGAAVAGETTWLHRDYPTLMWTNPGGDYAATPSFTFPLPGIGAVTTTPQPGLIADVQSWLNTPGTNHGWLLRTDELLPSTARRINSREALSLQPMLHVTYLNPGDAGSYGEGWPVNGAPFQLTITGPASPGAVLPIDYTNAPTNSIGANFLAIGLDAVGTPILASCTCNAYLPLAGFVDGEAFLTDAVGGGQTTFPVPMNAPGFQVSVQAAVLDPANPLGFSLSNAGVFLTQ